jgi:hypothetical protein
MPVTTQRNEQTVLGAEHELADPGEPADPRRLAERVLGDMPFRLGPRAGINP